MQLHDGNYIPEHIAIIMDGNGRWAEKRGLPRSQGHIAGAKNVRATVEYCAGKGVKFVTLYGFSSDNWSRSDREVNALMQVVMRAIATEMPTLLKANVRVRFIGSKQGLSSSLSNVMAKAEAQSLHCTGLQLLVAFNYSGRDEITQACQMLAKRVQNAEIAVEDIDAELFRTGLYAADVPDPDLLIRTSGEVRLSNFMVWQLAYTEFVFLDALWPDVSGADFDAALGQFSKRKRRFGAES